MSDPPAESAAPGVPLDMPLYKDIKRQFLAVLERGEWKPGEAIPAERRLAERFGVSVGTVRRAVDEFVAENILIRQQGRGTFVATHNRDRMLFYFFHIVPESGPKEYPEVRLLSFAKAKADRVAAERLGIAPGDPVLKIRNLLRLSHKPVMVDELTLPAARFAGLAEKQVRDRPSTIYNLYQEAFGISIVRTSERLRATMANSEVAQLLDIPRNTPLLQIRRVAFTYSDSPVEWRVSLVNTDAHEYWSDIRSN